ncbi:MAG: endonuclease/exonuclease/phosphatase family protein [Phycisphaerales bacterium]|jgi:endonuclease/exonuclease/phosphatase family metal-dependent hydrolase|nr:endonuclease/exonuclease/phosphatase family protein [Phycisphaerales bacterium]
MRTESPLLAAALSATLSTSGLADVTFMTFNIRYDTAADGAHAWPARRDFVLSTIAGQRPAAVAVQEALPHQLQAILAAEPSFTQIGTTRDGHGSGEFSGLLIDSSRLEVIKSGHLWLSETPDEVASVGWDAALPRTASWAQVRVWGSSGPIMMLIGTHLDHRGATSRVEAAQLIVSRLDAWSRGRPMPIAIMGDLNARPASACLQIFTSAGFTPATDQALGTFHGFDPDHMGPRIDYILLNDKWQVDASCVLRPRDGDHPASDHDPVVATVTPRMPQGTIGRPRRSDRIWVPPPHRLLDLDALPIPPALTRHAQQTASVLAARAATETDANQLSRVLAGFDYPFQLPELGAEVSDRLTTIPADPSTAPAIARAIAGDMLDAPPSSGQQFPVDAAFADAVLRLLHVPADTFYLEHQDFGLLDVFDRAASMDFGTIVAGISLPPSAEAAPGQAVPTGVTGEIISATRASDGWRIIGGPGRNTYDMSLIHEVYDTGGDDHYMATALVLGDRRIVDVNGDDMYTGTARQGPAAGLLGAWIIDDYEGDDRYGQQGGAFSTGAGAFGVGMIIDRGGDDIYMGTRWSIGAAMYGAGIILDLGKGDDIYLGDYLTDAVGGPRGFGLVLDEAGDDIHISDGPTPSAYDTPGVHASFSQGMGFGYRTFAAGGIGVLCDLSGDDRYQAGEFSQGGGYYHSLGVLRDFSGDDVYHGNRYAQGFGVHQAFGVLIDDAGDDHYLGKTAADQGAAWDIAAGALVDRGGDDLYEADGMAQGSAAQQAIAYLIDLGGSDEFRARAPAQGASGSNTYHWDAAKAHSFSLLLDRGDGVDTCSLPRTVHEVTVTATDPEPAGSGVGCFIDEPAGTAPSP